MIRWKARTEPLQPVAVVATNEAARVLAKRLLQRSDEDLQQLRGVSWNEGLAIEGAFSLLPWADGALYVGRDACAPKLLLPCALEPDNAPLDLWARAFERSLEREIEAPIVVLPDVQIAVSLAGARGVERAKLEEWLLSVREREE